MDRRQFFGESVAGTIIRLVLLSIVVGIVFSALDISPFNIVERLQQLIRRITELGFDAFHWAFEYFLLGAVVVVPIWFVVRLLSRPTRARVRRHPGICRWHHPATQRHSSPELRIPDTR